MSAMHRDTTSPPVSGAPSDVLALVTATDPFSPAANVAVALAARFGAHVTGCFIDPSLRMLHGGEADASVLALLLDTPAAAPDDREDFINFATEAGARGASWEVTRAGVAETLRRLGAWHDLVIVERDVIDGPALFDVLGEALLTCRLPCLILPPGWQAGARFSHVALAWNGSMESIRAIHSALPFVKLATNAVLIDGELPHYDEDLDRAPVFDPCAYLSHHGVAPHTRRLHVTPNEAGAALLQEAARARADLLVMGAYGHSRIRERVLGGATRHVLQHAPIPVLMQH